MRPSRRTFLQLLAGGVAVPHVALAQQPVWSGVFLDERRLQLIRAAVLPGSHEASSAVRSQAFAVLQANSEKALTLESVVPKVWYVPGFYRDAEGHQRAKNGLARSANAAYGMALLYRIGGDKRYAASAARIIDAWASGVESLSDKDDSMLSFSYHFPALILAASLLEGYTAWPQERREAFRGFVRTKALPMNTMARKNNWGNWGLVLVMASAAYLKDAALFQSGVARWKEFIETQIAEDGHLPEEVGRNNGVGERGIWYTHFCLMPQTLAAEIARVNGVDLYDYRSASGPTLRSAYERVVPWAHHPASFPYYKGSDPNGQKGTDYIGYWEILNARWPNTEAGGMLRERRPLTADHTAAYLTLTHGDSAL